MYTTTGGGLFFRDVISTLSEISSNCFPIGNAESYRVIPSVINVVLSNVGKTGEERMRGVGAVCWAGVAEVAGWRVWREFWVFWG